MTENRTLEYVLRALQLIFAIIIIGVDGYGKQNDVLYLVGAPLNLTPSPSYPRLSRPHYLRRVPVRQLLQLLRRPECMGLPAILRCLDNSGCHLPPHFQNHVRGSCLGWLYSCRRRRCGCPLMARWFHCCSCSNCDRYMFVRKKLMCAAQGSDSFRSV